jgi:lipopolysaccharide biosynthesis glycosyltransferase
VSDVTHVVVGYDPREALAFHVCCDSIIRNATGPVSITPLALNTLRPLYDEKHDDGSNAFIYSRFLTPYLMRYTGEAVFVDGDMVVRGDITQLPKYLGTYDAIAVVPHEYRTKHPVKYLNQRNDDYPKKNWSSVMVFRCSHFHCRKLTPEKVEKSTGAYLHRMGWTDRIGFLPEEWNRLVLEQSVKGNEQLLHYTIGTPCWKEYAENDAKEWHHALLDAMNVQGENPLEIVARAQIHTGRTGVGQ